MIVKSDMQKESEDDSTTAVLHGKGRPVSSFSRGSDINLAFLSSDINSIFIKVECFKIIVNK